MHRGLLPKKRLSENGDTSPKAKRKRDCKETCDTIDWAHIQVSQNQQNILDGPTAWLHGPQFPEEELVQVREAYLTEHYHQNWPDEDAAEDQSHTEHAEAGINTTALAVVEPQRAKLRCMKDFVVPEDQRQVLHNEETWNEGRASHTHPAIARHESPCVKSRGKIRWEGGLIPEDQRAVLKEYGWTSRTSVPAASLKQAFDSAGKSEWSEQQEPALSFGLEEPRSNQRAVSEDSGWTAKPALPPASFKRIMDSAHKLTACKQQETTQSHRPELFRLTVSEDQKIEDSPDDALTAEDDECLSCPSPSQNARIQPRHVGRRDPTSSSKASPPKIRSLIKGALDSRQIFHRSEPEPSCVPLMSSAESKIPLEIPHSITGKVEQEHQGRGPGVLPQFPASPSQIPDTSSIIPETQATQSNEYAQLETPQRSGSESVEPIRDASRKSPSLIGKEVMAAARSCCAEGAPMPEAVAWLGRGIVQSRRLNSPAPVSSNRRWRIRTTASDHLIQALSSYSQTDSEPTSSHAGPSSTNTKDEASSAVLSHAGTSGIHHMVPPGELKRAATRSSSNDSLSKMAPGTASLTQNSRLSTQSDSTTAATVTQTLGPKPENWVVVPCGFESQQTRDGSRTLHRAEGNTDLAVSEGLLLDGLAVHDGKQVSMSEKPAPNRSETARPAKAAWQPKGGQVGRRSASRTDQQSAGRDEQLSLRRDAHQMWQHAEMQPAVAEQKADVAAPASGHAAGFSRGIPVNFRKPESSGRPDLYLDYRKAYLEHMPKTPGEPTVFHYFLCALLEVDELKKRKMLNEFLFDDFLRVWATGYLEYREAEEDADSGLSAIQWYNEHVASPVCREGIVTKKRLDDFMRKYKEQFDALLEEEATFGHDQSLGKVRVATGEGQAGVQNVGARRNSTAPQTSHPRTGHLRDAIALHRAGMSQLTATSKDATASQFTFTSQNAATPRTAASPQPSSTFQNAASSQNACTPEHTATSWHNAVPRENAALQIAATKTATATASRHMVTSRHTASSLATGICRDAGRVQIATAAQNVTTAQNAAALAVPRVLNENTGRNIEEDFMSGSAPMTDNATSPASKKVARPIQAEHHQPPASPSVSQLSGLLAEAQRIPATQLSILSSRRTRQPRYRNMFKENPKPSIKGLKQLPPRPSSQPAPPPQATQRVCYRSSPVSSLETPVKDLAAGPRVIAGTIPSEKRHLSSINVSTIPNKDTSIAASAPAFPSPPMMHSAHGLDKQGRERDRIRKTMQKPHPGRWSPYPEKDPPNKAPLVSRGPGRWSGSVEDVLKRFRNYKNRQEKQQVSTQDSVRQSIE